MDFRITDIERTTVHVPYTEAPSRNMLREIPLWGVSEVLRVRTNVGLEGIGETILFYTWRHVEDTAIKRAIGQNPFDLLYIDELGAGLQMAIWDVAAKYVGVPVHALVGRKVRDAVPIGWWCIDMPVEDWETEARAAIDAGYTDMKLKGRPWYDIVQQIDAVCTVAPNIKIDIDFNSFLMDFETALPVCLELEKKPNVVIFESPIPQDDVSGNARLRQAIRGQISHHFGTPPISTAIRERVCDGLITGGGMAALVSHAHTAEQHDMPFWLQMVGTGITTTFANHIGASLTHATWPAITCLNIYEHQLLAEPIVVSDGCATVSDQPGLGISLDEDALDRFRVETPVTWEPPRWVHGVHFDDGSTVWFKEHAAYQKAFIERQLPTYNRHARLDTWYNDGSTEFERVFQGVEQGMMRA